MWHWWNKIGRHLCSYRNVSIQKKVNYLRLSIDWFQNSFERIVCECRSRTAEDVPKSILLMAFTQSRTKSQSIWFCLPYPPKHIRIIAHTLAGSRMCLVPTRSQYILFRVPLQWKLQIYCSNVDHPAEFALLKCDRRVFRRSTNLCFGRRLFFIFFFSPLFWSTACIVIICSIPLSAYQLFLYPRMQMLTARPSDSNAEEEKYLQISKLMTVLLFERGFFRELCCCFWIHDCVQCRTVGSLHSHFHSYSPYVVSNIPNSNDCDMAMWINCWLLQMRFMWYGWIISDASLATTAFAAAAVIVA